MKEFSDMFKVSIFARNRIFLTYFFEHLKKIRHISNDQCAEGVEREDVGFAASINPQDQLLRLASFLSSTKTLD